MKLQNVNELPEDLKVRVGAFALGSTIGELKQLAMDLYNAGHDAAKRSHLVTAVPDLIKNTVAEMLSSKDCTCRKRSDPNTDREGIIEFRSTCPVHAARATPQENDTETVQIGKYIPNAEPVEAGKTDAQERRQQLEDLLDCQPTPAEATGDGWTYYKSNGKSNSWLLRRRIKGDRVERFDENDWRYVNDDPIKVKEYMILDPIQTESGEPAHAPADQSGVQDFIAGKGETYHIAEPGKKVDPDDAKDCPAKVLAYAQRIAGWLASAYYPEVETWQVEKDIINVLGQIDNMVEGLDRKFGRLNRPTMPNRHLLDLSIQDAHKCAQSLKNTRLKSFANNVVCALSQLKKALDVKDLQEPEKISEEVKRSIMGLI